MEVRELGGQFEQASARAARLIRWMMITAIGLSYDFGQFNGTKMAVLLCLAAGFTLTQSVKLPSAFRIWNGAMASVLFDLFWLSLVLIVAGGTNSYYLFFYIAPGMLASYIGGRNLLDTVVLVQATATLAIITLNRPMNYSATRADLAWLVVLLALEWQAGKLLTIDRQERTKTRATNLLLEAERQQLLALINSLATAVAVIDRKGRVTLYNAALLELLNTNRQIQGDFLAELLPAQDAAGTPIDLAGLALHSTAINLRKDLVFLSDDGSLVNLEVIISPIWQPNSRNRDEAGSVLLLRDITKERTLEEQRDEFISLASHELRTPLAIAEANLSTATLPGFAKIEPKALALIDQAHSNIVFLGELIRDLTDLSLAEAGKIQLNLTVIDSADLLQQLVRNYSAEAAAKHLKLNLAQLPKLPPILTSEHQIREILQNFITNAIKYTEKGGIEVGARPDESGKQVVYWVKDTGIGIGVSDQKHLFSKFYRSEDYRTRQTSGTGLGLYITKKLAELLHGRVWFTSRLNRGSTFYLQVPTFPDAAIATKS